MRAWTGVKVSRRLSSAPSCSARETARPVSHHRLFQLARSRSAPPAAAALEKWVVSPPPLVARCVARALEEDNYSFLLSAARVGGAPPLVLAAVRSVVEEGAGAAPRTVAAARERADHSAASPPAVSWAALLVGSPFSATGVARAEASNPDPGGSSSSSPRPLETSSRLADPELDSIIRVDHAGEFGAVRIYDGQLAMTSDPEVRRQIEHMRDQEVAHLRKLEDVMVRRRARPTALLPVWDAAGFLLGAASAALGPRGAMACTVAVEEVITDHYNDQLRTLHEPRHEPEGELREVIRRNRDDEMEHREQGLASGAEQAPLYSLLTGVIRAGCRAAIWVAKRV